MEPTANLNGHKKYNIVSRFLHVYILIYIYLFILTSQFSPLRWMYKDWVHWMCKNIFHHQEIEYIKMTGSGDTTLDYWVLFVNIGLAAVIAFIVLLTDRKHRTFKDFHWLTVVIARYYVSMTMLCYGFAKLHDGQFPANSVARLEENVGDMSPMGIVWTMMGASKGYTFVAGLLEVIGGLLLLFRRTKTFGALFSMTVMINVALLNFFYDVPVKIFSSNVVLLCVFIVSGDAVALYRFFVLHQPSQIRYKKITADKKWKRITLICLKLLVIIALLYETSENLLYAKPPTTMEGAYIVKKFVVNNQELSSCNNDTIGWKKLLISYPGRASVKLDNDSMKQLESDIDTNNRLITLRKTDSHNSFAFLHYTIQNDSVTFTGILEHDSIRIETIRKSKKDYPLNKRSFHWVNEYPYNR